MTSTTDTTEHPDVSEISDFTEGLVPPSRAADLQLHLESCALCTDVHDSLEEIRGLLGTLPGPLRMPADIAGRIDAALAAEALLASTTPLEAASATSGADRSPDVSRETSLSPQNSTETSSPTPEAVRADRPAGRPKAATGPGRGGRTRRRRHAVLGAVFGTAAVGVSVFFFQSLQSADNDGTKAQANAAPSSPAPKSAAEFSATGLQSRVDTLLAAPASTKSDRRAATEDLETPDSPMLHSLPKVPSCVQQGTGRTEAALAAEQGSYEGSPAYLVVLPHPGDTTRVQAYVIDATCVEETSTTKGKVLLTHSYPRR
ncbi:hypothetical protein [Streptomyces corynorhini]|uniref:Zf-HC2 domain-containing protein n=1 Tax=Streptomyces corynorhini TaxID=2282652 RepID=A0A370B5U4_9ACTN|nr:hypothetical protein [Streptomyces corynorhini]RDG36961.1 hypothetical protein DVH02_17260 [Streptomyces corynorhini]